MERVGIGEFCMSLMRLHPTMSNEQILSECLAKFPYAKTKMSSIYWYRNEIRKEGGSRRRDPADDAEVGWTRSAPDEQSVAWPDWPAPSPGDVLQLARITAPYVRFLHPDIVRRLVEDNQRRAASWAERLRDVGIDPSLYLWPRGSCAFPGVQRSPEATGKIDRSDPESSWPGHPRS